MKRILLLVTGLLISLVTSAQIASSSQFGVIKIGTGLSVDANGFLTSPFTNIVAATGGTSAAIQQAVNTAGPYTTIVWSGTVVQTTDIEIASKSYLQLGGYGRCGLTRANFANQIIFRGNNVGVILRDIDFANTSTTAAQGILVSTEQGPETDILVDGCSFTNASATNAVAFSADGGAQHQFIAKYKGIKFKRDRFVGIGRMAIEVLNHVWDGTATQTVSENIEVSDCYFENIGTLDANGMAVSISGLHRYVKVFNNIIYDAKLTSIEIIGGDNVVVDKNFIKDINNTTTAIVVSDGYKNGSSGFVKNMEITNNVSDTKGRAFVLYYATNVTYSNNRSTSLIPIDVKSNDCTLSNNHILVTGAFNALWLDNSSRNTVVSNWISTYPNTQAGQTSSVIYLKAGSNQNFLASNTLVRTSGAFNVHIEQASGITNNIGTTAGSATSTINNYIER